MKRPERYSQSILRLFSDCPHAAMLYEKHRETRVESHERMRGTAFHRVAERATKECIVQSEPQIPGDVIKRIVDEVLAEPDIVLNPMEADRVRVASYHWAEGTVLDLASIVAVEQLFTMGVGDRTLSGKIDLASIYSDQESGTVCEINDYKTTFNLPAENDYAVRRRDGSLAWAEFQGIFYALLVAFGGPEGFPDGELSKGIDLYRIAQIFPLYLVEGDQLFLAQRTASLKPEELHDHRAYLEALVAKLDYAFEQDEWPAVPGSVCGRCPARFECPLPIKLRDMRGMIDSPEAAEEAAQRHFFLTDRKNGEATILKRELKAWAEETEGAVPCGSDYEYSFKLTQETKTPDWEKLAGAIKRATLYGEPFNVEDWIQKRESTRFERRKVEKDGR